MVARTPNEQMKYAAKNSTAVVNSFFKGNTSQQLESHPFVKLILRETRIPRDLKSDYKLLNSTESFYRIPYSNLIPYRTSTISA